jgi:hypothetical protein
VLQEGTPQLIGQPARNLHRFDLGAIGLCGRNQAGAHLRAIQQHRTGAAVAGFAADLGAG